MDRDKLRAQTLSNNLVWLRSFGCAIKREGNLVWVNHPKLREFSACLVLDHGLENLAHLDSALSPTLLSQAAPDVYLDSEIGNGRAAEWLTSSGFRPILTSIITAVEVLPGHEAETMSVERATISEQALWCAMYAQGFGRTEPRIVKHDAERWAATFSSDEVRNWFVVEEGRRIGVCQTCTAHGVVGIYSFTLLPAERGIARVMPALRAVRAELLRKGAKVAYFERTQKIGSPPREIGFTTGIFLVVREFTAYRQLASAP
jgi:hypothetical protein